MKLEKKSAKALYPSRKDVVPKRRRYLRVFYANRPAVIPIVVGSDAAHTPI
jgi:hypothetical protein